MFKEYTNDNNNNNNNNNNHIRDVARGQQSGIGNFVQMERQFLFQPVGTEI